MENSQHNSTLHQKLDQHDLGYRPGAWENFEQMLVANPVIAPKKQFWDYKKWLGIGSAAVLISVASLFFIDRNTHEVQQPVLATPAPVENANQEIKPQIKTDINNNTTTKSTKVETKNVEKEMGIGIAPSTLTEKSVEHLSQNDDNRLPHEAGELKLRPVQQAQRASKSGSDDSAVLPTSKKNDSDKANVKKNNVEQNFHKAPDAHELEENTSSTTKTKN